MRGAGDREEKEAETQACRRAEKKRAANGSVPFLFGAAGGQEEDRRNGEAHSDPGQHSRPLPRHDTEKHGNTCAGHRGHRRRDCDDRRGERRVQRGEPRRTAHARHGAPCRIGDGGRPLPKEQRRAKCDKKADELRESEHDGHRAPAAGEAAAEVSDPVQQGRKARKQKRHPILPDSESNMEACLGQADVGAFALQN